MRAGRPLGGPAATSMPWRPRGLQTRPGTGRFAPWAPRSFFHFELLHQSRRSRARVGRIHTPHGVVDTPGFVAVATNGALKFVDHRQADEAGQQLMFCNTYHLLLHPGSEVVRGAGGLHRFMNRLNRPLITDSGGFQIFSMAQSGPALPGDAEPAEGRVGLELWGEGKAGLAEEPVEQEEEPSMKSSRPAAARRAHASGSAAGSVKVSEDGVQFRSYRDGSLVKLTPESSIDAQKAFGADIIIPLDILPPYHTHPSQLELSVNRTHRWEERSLARHLESPSSQAMYAVLHGGLDRELRRRSVEHLSALPFDGWAIGGSLGRHRGDMLELLDFLAPLLPERGPRHLLGIADERSLGACAVHGIDTFDSCFPTRLGRHGTLLTRQGRLKIGQAAHRDDYGPIDPQCDGFVSRTYSRAYLHHLWKAHEPLVHGLLTLHNIKFMNDYCAELRQRILRNEV